MKPEKMRKSNVVLLSALGILALMLIILTGVGRIAFSRMTSAEVSDRVPVDFSNRVSKDFDVGDFRGITFIGSWEVNLKQGDDWQVELDFPKGLEDTLIVEVQGGQLTLDPGFRMRHKLGWNWWRGSRNKHLTARIVMPELQELNISGASDLDFSGFKGKLLNITITGAGNIEGDDGRYTDLSLTMSGAANIDLHDMSFVNAQVTLSGAGNVELGMDGGVLSGNLSGFGNIEYYGPVSDQRVHVSGFGQVRQRN
jgi:hypothetical protein